LFNSKPNDRKLGFNTPLILFILVQTTNFTKAGLQKINQYITVYRQEPKIGNWTGPRRDPRHSEGHSD